MHTPNDPQCQCTGCELVRRKEHIAVLEAKLNDLLEIIKKAISIILDDGEQLKAVDFLESVLRREREAAEGKK